jgi:hypothetical protein
MENIFLKWEAWALTCHSVINANDGGIYTVLNTNI